MSNFQQLFDLIGELARRRYQMAERNFASLGLNHSEARLLSLLWQQNGQASQDSLSGMLSIDRTNVGRALQHLEQAGYILRQTNGEDRRAKLVQITEKGRTTVVEIKKLGKQIAEGFFGELTASEAAVAVKLLRKALPREHESD